VQMATAAVNFPVRRDPFLANLAGDSFERDAHAEYCIIDLPTVHQCRRDDDSSHIPEGASRRKSLNPFNNSLEGFEQGPIIGKAHSVRLYALSAKGIRSFGTDHCKILFCTIQ
jgi:hypothetical protein